MTKEKIGEYLTDIPKPAPPQVEGQEMLRLTLFSARRSSTIGLLLIALPALLLTLLFLGNSFHLFPGLVRRLAGSGSALPLRWRAVLAFLFLVGFPFIAVILNLFAITWFRYYPLRREFVISVRMRWVNLLIAIAGSAIAAFYILHLLADSLFQKP